MKKWLSILLIIGIVLSFAACGTSESEAEPPAEQGAATQTNDPVEESPEPVAAEALELAGGSLTIGDVTLTAEFLKLDEPFIVQNTSKGSMAMDGNTLYISDDAKLIKKYTLDGNTLSFVKALEVDRATGVAVGQGGKLYAGGGALAANIYDAEGNLIGEYPTKGIVKAAKNADFGLSYFSGRDAIEKTVGASVSNWAVSGLKGGDPATIKGPLKTVSSFEIVNNHVLVAGAVEDKLSLVVFDFNGNEIARSSDRLKGNGIQAMTETENGYMTASVSTIHLTKKDGTLIGDKNANALFGVKDSIWLNEFIRLDDGSVLVGGGVKRSDDVAEFVLFKVKGF